MLGEDTKVIVNIEDEVELVAKIASDGTNNAREESE